MSWGEFDPASMWLLDILIDAVHYYIERNILVRRGKIVINYLGVGGIASWQREVLLLHSVASETWNIKGNTAPTHTPQSVSYTWLTVLTVLLHRWLPPGYLYCLCWVILGMFRWNTNWFCRSVPEVKGAHWSLLAPASRGQIVVGINN